jgi:hypothetical protein
VFAVQCWFFNFLDHQFRASFFFEKIGILIGMDGVLENLAKI